MIINDPRVLVKKVFMYVSIGFQDIFIDFSKNKWGEKTRTSGRSNNTNYKIKYRHASMLIKSRNVIF